MLCKIIIKNINNFVVKIWCLLLFIIIVKINEIVIIDIIGKVVEVFLVILWLIICKIIFKVIGINIIWIIDYNIFRKDIFNYLFVNRYINVGVMNGVSNVEIVVIEIESVMLVLVK